MKIRWQKIIVSTLGLLIWTVGAIAIYDIFFQIKQIRVLPDGTIEYLTNCPSISHLESNNEIRP
jgi:hypothetical protein